MSTSNVPPADSGNNGTANDGANQRKPRTLVLCFDGTSSEYDADNTNVVKFYALLKKDSEEQICYYQAGVGTWFEPGVVSPLFEWGAKVLDLAFAWYLDAHVMDGYKFLMQNYRAGDKICIFGFSRGAYTARALGGLLYKVGLLPKDNYAQVPFAYKMYKRTDEEGLILCAGFKETYCQTVEIEFMGVWDTVSSVGVLAGRTLPFTNSNRSIKTFRHALSIDERRAKFRPNNYYRSPLADVSTEPGAETDTPPADPKLARFPSGYDNSTWGNANITRSGSGSGDGPGSGSGSGSSGLATSDDTTSTASTNLTEEKNNNDRNAEMKLKKRSGTLKKKTRAERSESEGSWRFFGAIGSSGKGSGKGKSQEGKGKKRHCLDLLPYANQKELDTDVMEVWFPGGHSDVGGGAVLNTVPQSISNISLRWMVREVMASGCGVRFDIPALMKAKIDLDPEPSAAEIEMDLADALEPIHDMLEFKTGGLKWWLLEIIPLTYSWQDQEGVWHREFGFNLGKGRKIADPQPKFHATVKRRMESTLQYKPRARWEPGTEVYVH